MNLTAQIGGVVLTPIVSGVYCDKVKPYVRRTHKTFTKEQKTYTKSSCLVGAHMLTEAIRRLNLQASNQTYQTIRFLATRGEKPSGGLTGLPIITRPYLFGLAIDCPPVKTKSSPNYGKPPGNQGDFDGFQKAMLDTARWVGLVPEDSLAHYRGQVTLELGTRDPVEVSDDGKWRFYWAFFRALGP